MPIESTKARGATQNATPTRFKPSGGYGVLRIVDFSWQTNRSLAVHPRHVISGSRALRGER